MTWLARLLALGILTAPAAVFGFCRTTTCARLHPPEECVRDEDTGCWVAGTPLTWHSSCVSFSVAQAGSPKLGLDYQAANDLVSAAFASWPTTSCGDVGAPGIAVAATASVSCDRLEYNPTGPNSNAVLFRDEAWPHDDNILALTTVTFNTRTGEILDADMEINSQSITVDDVSFVVTHEAGHFFGLDHNQKDMTAIMFPQDLNYAPPGTMAMLAPDDTAAICAAYPPTQTLPDVCVFAPAKGFASDCGGDVVAGCAVAPPPRDGASSGRGQGRAIAIAVGALALASGLVRRHARRRGQSDRRR